ncbi:MAG TPA: 2Fe-2S iron-sulfur cluster-binding protein [Usitatibacter sp.]|jgi:NADH-quinone oxidoreductase subunit G|nr:2Fe-2S iron-sulfur cluster-binding protein [Usitatibacter sp.]
MPRIYIDGHPIDAEAGQTVMQAAVAHGIEIPAFCWHPKLSVSGSCRVCAVQVEGRSWVEISCNMPVAEDLKVLTDTDLVRAYRKSILELTTLNHPVDCGICDKSGECTLQDYHYEHNGAPSNSREVKVHATKFHELSGRITLDNERCILCSRCVRFTHEVSKSKSLGIVHRGDSSLVRASEDGAFERDAYSDNVVDICPVGALLSRSFLYKSRVWYLQATPSVCPRCSRGCNVSLWHRKPEWALRVLDPRKNVAIERVTPRDNPAVNGPWMCNVGRDLARVFERERALEAMRGGVPVTTAAAVEAARQRIAQARHPVALVSNGGSNEELAAFRAALGDRFDVRVKCDRAPLPGEVVEDDFLIRADKNPNTAGARALFPRLDDPAAPLPAETDLLLVWGEGFDPSRRPSGARVIALDGWSRPEHAEADVFIPLSIQTERRGTYTNFEGVASPFEACFPKPEAALHAETLFAALAVRATVIPAKAGTA